MIPPEDRRQAARILTEFPLVLHDEKGVLVDGHALAHDVSTKGFRAECSGVLEKGQFLRFQVQFSEKQSLSGRCRVAWVERTDLAVWAGAEFLRLTWSDRRLIRRVTRPAAVDWSSIFDKALTALIWGSVALALWSAVTSRFWRPILLSLVPKAIATLVLGWALREILRSRR